MRPFYFLFLLVSLIGSSFGSTSIKIGWISRLPYSYQTNNYSISQVSGLDIDFIRDLARRLNIKVTLVPINEKDVLRSISNHEVDAILGYPINSLPNVTWSESYRQEAYVAYLSANSKEFFYTPQQLLDATSETNPLGLTSARNLGDATLNDFINDPRNSTKIHKTHNESDLLEEFLQGSLNMFVGDRIVFSTLLHKLHQWKYVREIKLDLHRPIALGILNHSPLMQKIEDINLQITAMHKDGKIDRLFTQYLTPAVLMHTIDEGWLRLIELIGIVSFAIYAFIHGFYRHMAFVKTVGFSMVIVFTGPVLKDILTTGHIEFFRNPYYLSVVIGIIFVAHAIISTLRSLSYRQIRTYIVSENKDRWIQEITCALGLASYTISGVLYAITSADTGWFWEGMLGTITATSGLLIAHELYKLPSKINFLFVEISFGWGTLLALYFTLSRSTINFDQESIFMAVMTTLFGIFLSRMLALYHQISSIGFGRRLRETLDNL
ncbi:MAG: transporter substrate-binding domain-containing protein [Alphaproteobacteria bacterium]|nr:transporter substrate-binding domain-containing protein [Alphaproteobacteria bacterium]